MTPAKWIALLKKMPKGMDIPNLSDCAKPAVTTKVTVAELQAELLAKQEKKGLRKVSTASSRSILRGFVAQYGHKRLGDVTRDVMEAWLDSCEFACLTTRENALRYLIILFNFAIKREYTTENPARKIEKSNIEAQMPTFVPLTEVQSLFANCERHTTDMAAALAIGFFAGIRTGELHQLVWSDVKWDIGVITVRPEIAKKGRARHVEILPNLRAWLDKYKQPEGLISPSPRRVGTARRKICTSWLKNGMRHTFGTMHYSMFQDAPRTAAEMGHRGTNLLFDHYRGLATKQDAEQYWEIRP